MDLKNWYDRVREQLDRLDFPALWAGFAPCPFALYTHDTAVLNGEMMPRPAEFYGCYWKQCLTSTRKCRLLF